MKSNGINVKNGKAFEYALLSQYSLWLKTQGVNISVIEDKAYETAKLFYEGQSMDSKVRFDESAKATIETIALLEPGLTSAKDEDDYLLVSISSDSDGKSGDVRDVVFRRPAVNWEMGFSAKNNNEAVKHSRLSNQIDFGRLWLGRACSEKYWQTIKPIFDKILEYKAKNLNWKDISDKTTKIYKPLLEAFLEEMIALCDGNPDAPANLVRYLIGRKPFYKIVKDDRNNLVVVKAFNIGGGLNTTINGKVARYKTPKLNLPSRIVELAPKEGTDTTLIMILDQGWEISFRIHNAETRIVPSLKFDIQLLGNPPILFTQHLFQ